MSIAKEITRLNALNFGPSDYAASVRTLVVSVGTMDHWEDQYLAHRFHYPMSRVVIAAHLARLRAIDEAVADFRHLKALRNACIIARGLGYDSKWCIHPGQIEIANEIFSPTEVGIAWAQRVMTAYRAAAAEGVGAMAVDNKIIDAASIQMAEATSSLAEQAGMV